MRDVVLVTGADGLIGRRLVRHLLATGNHEVVAWLHASDERELAARSRAFTARLGASHRVNVVGGDLRDAAPFADVPGDVTVVVHAAAATRFNVASDVADAVNVAGARRVFEHARTLRRLRSLVHLSTLYVAGLATGDVLERPLDPAAPPPRFANHYERSKHEAERVLVAEFDDLPWRIARSATVIADDASGVVSRHNAVHNTLKLLFYGLLSIVPGDRDVPVHVTTTDVVVRATLALAAAEAALHRVAHVTSAPDDVIPLGELLDVAFTSFGRDADFAARRLLPPLLCDRESFDDLTAGVTGFGGAVVTEGLASVAPFAHQLFAPKSFHDAELRALVPGLVRHPTRALVTAMCDHLVATRFGRREAPA